MKSKTQETTNLPRHAARANFAHVCLATCRRFLTELKSAKASILAEFRDRLDDHDHLLELAVNEAEALAWQSGFPQLLFPELAMEKAQSAAEWHARQQWVLRQGSRARQAVAV